MIRENAVKKIGICGHFGDGLALSNGQTIKTKTIASALKKRLGEDQVATVDTHGGMRQLPRMARQLWRLFGSCSNVAILPAHHGLLVFAPLCRFFAFFKRRNIHYIVIGGWLETYLNRYPWLLPILKGFRGIYVETRTMKQGLEAKGLHNLVLLPNFKELSILEEAELTPLEAPPYRLCTFSRVMPEKGIGDAVNAVRTANELLGAPLLTLDIYGQIESGCEAWFEALQKEFPPEIRYGGVVAYGESVETLRRYAALLFPTRFETEGIPGTILDAYSAGVPVIASRWKSFSDVVDEGRVGLGFPLGQPQQLTQLLVELARCPERLSDMRGSCLKKAGEFDAQTALRPLLERL